MGDISECSSVCLHINLVLVQLNIGSNRGQMVLSREIEMRCEPLCVISLQQCSAVVITQTSLLLKLVAQLPQF